MSSTVLAPTPVAGGDLPLVRVLSDQDVDALTLLLARHPYDGAPLAARVQSVGSLDPSRLGGAVLATYSPDEAVRAVCFVGGSVLPVGGGAGDASALAATLAARTRTAAEIVGEAELVAALWHRLAPAWSPARLYRGCQPLLVLQRPAAVDPDPWVRAATPADLDAYLPAAAAMFEEELEISPLVAGGEQAYRARLLAVIRAGRALIRTDACGRVVFKAELGAVCRQTAQIQGVWVHPSYRRQGLATGAMAAVVAQALRHAPAASLYVNHHNVAARALYRKLGFTQVSTLATVLF